MRRAPASSPGPAAGRPGTRSVRHARARRLDRHQTRGARFDESLPEPDPGWSPARRRRAMRHAPALLLAAVGLELADIGPQVAGLLLVLDAGEEHFRARDFCARVLDVVLECRLAPGDARILVGVAVIVARDRAGLAAVEAVELRSDAVLGALADLVAGHALLENGLAGFRVLCPTRARRRHECGRRNYHNNLHVDLLAFPQDRAPRGRPLAGNVAQSGPEPDRTASRAQAVNARLDRPVPPAA